MTVSQPPFEDSPQISPVETPRRRLRDARWALLASAVILTGLVVVYEIPVWVGFLCFAATLAATLSIPRNSASRRLKINAQRRMRRMWPGTDMKVTVDALPTPCFVADARGITRYVNARAMEIYPGAKPGDPLSFSLRAPSLLEAFDRACSNGTAERINWIEKVPTETWLEAYIAPIHEPGPQEGQASSRKPAFVLVVVQDQTENRRLERMRTDFVANASHELRTPLASLTGFVETLQGPARDDAEARDRFLSIMLDQAGRMRRLIDDILSLSRIELRAHVRPQTSVDLCEIVRHTNDALGPLARDMKMTIRLDLPEKPVMISGDRDELIQVTENLVENALKYGSTGEVVDVSLTSKQMGEGEIAWELAVRDYGEGIAPEHLPRLTERFYRVDVDSSRAMKGTGLGLAIVKHILTRHRARLDVESAPGKGATFKVIISG
ncbi:two-component sensor histidine kinase [Labrenzia sp. R4_1]|uniref:ATP-binding protein n=1 Tax=Labrenzia sp. R4_1 TaxID=2821106 RepID=UPI001AD9544E|nr:ATP-binding protein [Labrenzia sp. R4_1]MBO9423960.1 two-component sensor histidine kinase [Labrenzia sp. R4_1]